MLDVLRASTGNASAASASVLEPFSKGTTSCTSGIAAALYALPILAAAAFVDSGEGADAAELSRAADIGAGSMLVAAGRFESAAAIISEAFATSSEAGPAAPET